MKTRLAPIVCALLPALTLAQVPVDDDGNVIGPYQSGADVMPIGEDGIPRLTQSELRELVGPIALYPDDLLAVVLPAAAYPLQVVEAARFLEDLESDPTLEPNPDWDDSIIALINYPDVVALLNEDLDWTWRLGEAVVAQQGDVVSAVESFRDVAYAAGNLKSDEYQTVARDDGAIRISPTSEDVIYVPYYEPERVVHYQPRPVYYYYPQPRPVYYYPYAANHYFDRGFFWGVTTAFTIGWHSDSLHVYHASYRGHPYYGRTYWNDYWYRRPSINVYNTTYVNNTNVYVNNRQTRGDRWQARQNRREYVRREGYSSGTRRSINEGTRTVTRQRDTIAFRERPESTSVRRSTTVASTNSNRSRAASRSREDQRNQTRVTRTDQRADQRPAVRQRTESAQRERTTTQSQRTSNTRTTNTRTSRSETRNTSTRSNRTRTEQTTTRSAPAREQATRQQSSRQQSSRQQASRQQTTRQPEARSQTQSRPAPARSERPARSETRASSRSSSSSSSSRQSSSRSKKRTKRD